jgi:hypothetical protein
MSDVHVTCVFAWQAMRLRSQRLRHLDITGCSALRELQVSGLEKPVAQLMASSAVAKVRTCRLALL